MQQNKTKQQRGTNTGTSIITGLILTCNATQMASHLSVCLSVRDVEVSSSHTLRGTLQNFGHGKSGFLLKCGKIGPI